MNFLLHVTLKGVFVAHWFVLRKIAVSSSGEVLFRH